VFLFAAPDALGGFADIFAHKNSHWLRLNKIGEHMLTFSYVKAAL
jgi:hypothetical protein